MESLFGELAFALFIAAHVLALVVLPREHHGQLTLLLEGPCSYTGRLAAVVLGASAP
jgi:hypothetical protein